MVLKARTQFCSTDQNTGLCLVALVLLQYCQIEIVPPALQSLTVDLEI